MRIERANRLRGVVVTPGDKSISHRALMISALSPGVSTISGISEGHDVLATQDIMQQLGARIERTETLLVEGPRQGLSSSSGVLDCGNSGTTIRLLMGILSGVRGTHHLDGDFSLRTRPMNRVARPLHSMGVQFSADIDSLRAPFALSSSGATEKIVYQLPVPSAQVKSAVLFAGLYADGTTVVNESVKTRSNTEDMLLEAGLDLDIVDVGDGRQISIRPGRPEPRHWDVPQDPSQAAFFVVAALVHPDAELQFSNIYAAPERIGFLHVLERMGARLETVRRGDLIDIVARSSELQSTRIQSSEIPSVDEVPILVVAAAAATGRTEFIDMAELRVKESDRFGNSVALARELGAVVEEDGDSFAVTGVGGGSAFRRVRSAHAGDHRMTMSAAIAGLCGNGSDIAHPESIGSSFPTFFHLLASLSS